MPLLSHLVAKSARRRGLLNFSEGFRMLRDREVPGRTKLAALTLGVLATALLEALEFPLEAVVAFFLPLIGEALDFAFDGIEFVILPLLFASLIVQRLAIRPIRR